MLRTGLLIVLVLATLGIAAEVWAKNSSRSVSTVGTGTKIGDVRVNPKDGAAMVWVPKGEFLMGISDAQIAGVLSVENTSLTRTDLSTEQPQRKVYLDGYWIYKYEVTVAQYKKFCSDTKRRMPKAPSWGWVHNHPMCNVTWKDAADYAKWAGVSLPTEAQWEKAARGKDGRMYPWGNKWEESSKCNWGYGGPYKTQPVGSYPAGASPYGCMDMAGNVGEMCADWFDEDYYRIAPSRNPRGPAKGNARVLRGGSWFSHREHYLLSCVIRYPFALTRCGADFGFRCAKSL